MFQPPIFFKREKRTKKYIIFHSPNSYSEKKVEIWYFSLQFLKEREERKKKIQSGGDEAECGYVFLLQIPE